MLKHFIQTRYDYRIIPAFSEVIKQLSVEYCFYYVLERTDIL